jgi:hypothetical protein
MGRGLGKLQKAILVIAYEKHNRNSTNFVDAREILIKHYKFPTNGRPASSNRGLVFDRRAIGFKQYMSASVTVAQCFNRLAAKGLVERQFCYGITLTRAGVRQARAIQSQP